MDAARHLLVIMPHTGECFSCSGTVAKHTRAGDRATLVSVCSGAERLGEAWERHVEGCRRGAAVLGAKFEALSFASSGVLEVTRENKVAIAEVIRRLRPDVMITMPREEMYEQPHSDHEATHLLVYHARDLAARRFELPSGLPSHFVNDLYFLGDGSPGDIFVDVTDVQELVGRAWEAIAYGDLLSASHGALPLGVSLKRPVVYQRRVGPDCAVEAFRACYYREKTLELLPT